jgi:hypothetical protein
MQHEMRAIEELVFVTKLSFVPAHKDKEQGFRATLSCALCRWYDSCGKGQEQAVQLIMPLRSGIMPVLNQDINVVP